MLALIFKRLLLVRPSRSILQAHRHLKNFRQYSSRNFENFDRDSFSHMFFIRLSHVLSYSIRGNLTQHHQTIQLVVLYEVFKYLSGAGLQYLTVQAHCTSSFEKF